VTKFATRIGRRIDSVGQQTMARLRAYHWPGNVRELENILERAVILSSGSTMEIDEKVFAGAPRAGVTDSTDPIPLLDLEAVERNHILNILKQTNWIIEGPQGAATILKVHPNTLRSRLKKMGMTRESHEPS
jgi:DNA-binding NtrC family response regulator